MAIRGERIGTAYIKLLVDGSGMDESVRESMADADDAVKEGAEEHSDTYWDSFDKQTEKNRKFEEGLEEKFQKAKGKFQAIGEGLGEELQTGVAKGIEDMFVMRGTDEKKARDYGQRAGEIWAEGFSKTGGRDFDAISLAARAFSSVETEIRKIAQAAEDSGDDTDSFRKRLDKFSDTTGRMFGKGSRNDFLNFTGSVVGGLSRMTTKALNMFGALEKGVSLISKLGTMVGERIGLSSEAMGMIGRASGVLASAGGAAALIVVILGPIAGLISGLAAAITALASSVAFALGAGLGLFVGLLPLLAGGVVAAILAFKGLEDVKGGKSVLKDLKDGFKGLKEELAKGALDGIRDFAEAFGDMMDKMRESGVIRRVGEAIGQVARMFGNLLKSPAFTQLGEVFGRMLPQAIKSFGRITANVMGGFGGVFRAAMPIVRQFLRWIEDLTGRFSEWANSTKGQAWLKDFFKQGAQSAREIWDLVEGLGKVLGKLFTGGRETGDDIFSSMTKNVEKFADFIQEQADNGNLARWFEDGEEIIGKVGDALVGLFELFDALDTPENRAFASALIESIAQVVVFVARAVKLIEVFLSPVIRIVNNFLAIINGIAKVINWVLKYIVKAFEWFADKLWGHSILTDMTKAFSKAFGLVGRVLRFFWNGLKAGFNIVKNALEKVGGWFKDLATKIGTWIGKGWDKVQAFLGKLRDFPGKAKEILDKVVSWFKALPGKLWDAFVNASQKVATFVSNLRSKFADAVQAVKEKMSDIVSNVREFVGRIPGVVSDIGRKMYDAAKGLGGKFLDGIGAGLKAAGGIASDIGEGVENVINGMIDQINNLLEFDFKVKGIGFKVDAPDIGHVNLARGGIVFGPTHSMIGEAGPEAVVPLSRNLAMVDPSVRALSAFAQRQSTATLTGGGGRSIDVGGITVITPTTDPVAVAQETINRMVASTYF